MFSFMRKRILKEHMKIMTQNYKALTYLTAFLPPDVSKEYSEFIQDVHSTWRPGERLDDTTLRLLLAINKDLRRAYVASPARAFGMKSFDEEFKPVLGWNEHYSQYL